MRGTQLDMNKDKLAGAGMGAMTIIKRVAVVLAAALAVGCGGGGGSAGVSVFDGTAVPGTTPAPVASDLSLALSSTSLPNNGSDRITITATAVDANRNALAGIPVTISVDNGAVAAVSATKTDDQGIVTATVGPGSDRTNRVITVNAVSGSLAKSATFQITGSKLTSTLLPAVIAPGAAGKVDFRLVDVNGNPLVGLPIIVTGVGNVETPGTTGSNGDFSYAYTAPATSGDLTIRASAAGVTSAPAVVQVQAVSTIPVATQIVRSASVSANPNTVPVNTEGAGNLAVVRALFLGDNNAAIKNIRVRFDRDGDVNSIPGSFTSDFNILYSDANGVVTSTYIPGSRSSPTGGVTIRACWSYSDFAVGTCPNAARTTVTVISEPLSVSIGTNNLIEIGSSGLDYVKRYVIQVNDSSGLAKADVQISPSVDLPRYFKGEWVRTNATVGPAWAKIERAQCDNEDLNRNGISEVYANGWVEDANGSFNLTPGRPALDPRKADVAISFEGSSRTDTKGQVVIAITYPQNVASWVEFNILVSASGVSGTEGRANFKGVLPVLAAAIADTNIAPAFQLSPYGLLASPVTSVNQSGVVGGPGAALLICTNPN